MSQTTALREQAKGSPVPPLPVEIATLQCSTLNAASRPPRRIYDRHGLCLESGGRDHGPDPVALEAGACGLSPIIEREACSLRSPTSPTPGSSSRALLTSPEPIDTNFRPGPEDVEVVVIPMLAFDAEGNRFSYGAGAHDRFLCRYPHPKKIGIAFSCQQAECIPADENDVKMDYIVTEKDYPGTAERQFREKYIYK